MLNSVLCYLKQCIDNVDCLLLSLLIYGILNVPSPVIRIAYSLFFNQSPSGICPLNGTITFLLF